MKDLFEKLSFLNNLSPEAYLKNEQVKARNEKQRLFKETNKARIEKQLNTTAPKVKTKAVLKRRSKKPVLKQLPNVIDKTLEQIEQTRRTAYIARNQSMLDLCDMAINAIAIMRDDVDRLDKAQDLKIFGAFMDIRQKIDEAHA